MDHQIITAENAYLLVSLISVLLFFTIPWAVTRLIKEEVDFETLRADLKDVLKNVSVFLCFNGAIQLIHVYERMAHPNFQMTLRLATSLNAARDMSGFLVLFFIFFSFARKKRKCQKITKTEAALKNQS